MTRRTASTTSTVIAARVILLAHMPCRTAPPTQVNMTRTIEQILGLTPMNQFDLVASPMRTAFVNNPPANNFKPWTHVPNQVPLNQGVGEKEINIKGNDRLKVMRAAWLKKKEEIFAGKLTKPDSEDPDTVNHLN